MKKTDGRRPVRERVNIEKKDRKTGTVKPRRIRREHPQTPTEMGGGLSAAQVQERMFMGYVNTPVESPSKTVKEIIKGNLLTYFNMVFLVLAVLLIAARSFRNLTFMGVIICNAVIGIVQEIRAKQTLDELNMLNSPKTQVLRDGKEASIKSSKLVIDDVMILHGGNQIPADAIVLEGEIQVNESLITGESDEISKKPGDSLLSGSFVVGGKCYARASAVGEDSYISKLTLEAKTTKKKNPTEMMQSLDRIVLVAGILIIPIGVTLYYQSYFINGDSFPVSITSMVAAVIGMIPEGLYLLASIALAVSSMRLAQKKVLVHDMKCIEMLSRVDVLCVDKTGTITESDMTVEAVVTLSPEDIPKERCELAITDFVSNMDADNSTMETLIRHFIPVGTTPAQKVVPFSSAFKYSAVSYVDSTFILGAPEFVLREKFEEYADLVNKYGSDGLRVLVFGRYDGVADGKELTEDFEPWCLILLSNRIREAAPETFRYFAEQGVTVKVISGDNPVTVSDIAVKAGIKKGRHYVDARTLKTDKEIAAAMDKYTVFGRVTPDQKRKFVRALKAKGHTVAMTGDGVNDILALRDADCSIAMASGSDAAASVADLVLLRSDFSTMPQIVGEGRRVVNNITRSASLFLVKNIFSLLLALFSMFFMLTYPLEPAQISLISMFTIGIPGFFLALQPNNNRFDGHFLPNVLAAALPAGITDALIVGALVVFGNVFNVDATDVSVASTLLLVIVGLMILYRISRPLNKFRAAVILGCTIGLVWTIFFAHRFFAITRISLRAAMLLGVFAICTEPLLRYSSRFVEWAYGKLKKRLS